jgi:two-component system chemotaxis response regulator CheY
MALNVLIVDDSAVMRAMIIRTLRVSRLPLGEISEAANGEEALRALDEHWIDLALVDLNMPVMNGEDLIDHVRATQHLENLPIVVVSTEGSDRRIRAIRAKGARFVRKPFTPELLRDEIVQLTGDLADDGCDNSAEPGSDVDF